MSKKILFINTSKLMGISAGVLLVIFCMVGMSFTPEDGEGVTDPNDSTYVTGPRRSHWETGGCNSTTHSEDDFGKVIATSTGNGSVTLTSSGGGTVVSTSPTSGTSSTSVTIVWKCGEKGKGANQGTAANHTRSFTFKATPSDGYNFAGWWTAQTGGTKVSGDKEYTESQELDEWNSAAKYTSEANAKTRTLYARFKEPTLVTVTFAASPNGSYTYSCAQGNGTVNSTTSPNPSVSTSSAIALNATPAPGYIFYGWYTLSGTTENFISYSAEASVTLDVATTIYAKFIPSDAALFQVVGEPATYYDLNVAATVALSATKKIVVPTADGTLYNYGKDYTIPSGVSLVIPYESTVKTYTSPSSSYEKNQSFSSASQYRLLTLGSGANITVAGSLYVMADLCSANGGAAGNGAPASAYGRIAMSENSSITINSAANLYCWGFITGTKGLVTIKNGGIVHEPLQHQNNPGGSKASAWNEKAFFMNQYYVQNVESPLKMEYGAVNQVYALMYIQGYRHANAALISKDNAGMFALTSSSSYLIRTYNPATDRTTYDIYGNAKLNYISMSVYIDIDTRNYVLPITSNLSIKCHTLNGTASTFSVPYAVSFLPGAELVVDEGVNVNISSKLIIYDRDEWIGNGFAEFNISGYNGGGNWTRSSFTPTRSYTRVNADLVDAKVDLNGTMNVSGSLYTTTHGAAIVSTNGTGIINLSAAAPGNSNDIQYKSNNLGTSTNVPMTPAQLKNADGSYLATAGAAANTTITYANGHWGWKVQWVDGTNVTTKYCYTNPDNVASWITSNKPADPSDASFKEWKKTTDNSTAQERVYTAQYSIAYAITYTTPTNGSYTIQVASAAAVSTSTTAESGQTITLAATPDEGYTLGSWSVTKTNGGATVTVTNNTFTMPAEAVTVSASFSKNNFDVTFDMQGHGVAPAAQSITANGKVSKPSDPSAENYRFDGWYKEPACTNAWDFASDVVTADMILYAKWTRLYTITWKVDGVTTKTEQVAEGTTPSYGDDPTKAETAQYTYSFSGWSPTPYAADKDQIYSGSFNASVHYYTITWQNWNGVTLKTDNLQYGATPSYSGTTPTKTDSETERSYTFKGWSPEVVDVAGDATYTAQFDMALTIGEGEHPYEVSGEETATITTVLVQGALKVPDGNNLTTNDLIIKASADNSGDVEGVENVSVTGHAYFDYEFNVDAWHWSAFGVPFEINLDEFAPLKEKTTPMVLGTDYDIVYYNTTARAQRGTNKRNWEYVENHEHKLIPGMAYLIAFNHPVGHVNTVRFTKASSAPINYTTAVPLTVTGAKGGDNNWNGIANPKMYHALLDAGVEECQVHDSGPIGGDGYDLYTMKSGETDYKFFVGKAAFVQTPQSQSTVEIDPATNQSPLAKHNAPRRAGAFEAVNPKYDIRISPIDGEMADRLFIRAEEGKEDDYVIVADLAKAGVSPARAQIWVDRYGYQLCKNTTALINDMATYPLGISVPQAGEYSLYMANEVAEDDNLYLTYDGRVIWNLGYAPYVLSLEKGVNEHYGLRLIHNTPAMEMDVEQVEATRAAQKMLIDQKVYILRGEQLYYITGQKAE